MFSGRGVGGYLGVIDHVATQHDARRSDRDPDWLSQPRLARASPDEVGRSAKARYVWQRFEEILRGRSILDVGADRCHLRKFVDAGAFYWGIGLGGTPDQEVDLEQDPIPFPDRSFDTVLCLDVLEHVENPHEVLDEVCRVSRRHVILSFPNPWGDMYRALRHGNYRPDVPVKYYGLPVEAPDDRHKWFFSAAEAKRFAGVRAARNGLVVVEAESMSATPKRWKHPLSSLAEWVLFRDRAAGSDLHGGTTWVVLCRPAVARLRRQHDAGRSLAA